MKLIYTFLILFFTSSVFAQLYYHVTTDVLNVRSSASKNAEIISKLNLGDSVYVVNYSSGWSQVKLNDEIYGYVSSKFISKDSRTYSKASTTENKKEKTSVWGTLAFLVFIFLAWVFKGSSGGKSPSSKSSKSINSKPEKVKPVKNELISQVKLEGSWYRVYNSDGKQLSVKAEHSNDYLHGYSDKIILLEQGSWYRVYDFNFKQIGIKAVHDNHRFISVAGNTITFQEGSWIRTYDPKFEQINIRPAH